MTYQANDGYNATPAGYDPSVIDGAYQRLDPSGELPFIGESDLEVIAREAPAASGDKETRQAAVICAFFICNLPFDC